MSAHYTMLTNTIPSKLHPQVEVRFIDLHRCKTGWENVLTVLSDDERQRASRFRFTEDRSRYVQVRAGLRWQLAEYLDLDPAELRFTYNHAGKPRLESGFGTGISFNVSHSGNLGLLAFGFGCRTGIDVEYMQPDLEFKALARHSFSASEQRQLRALDGPNLIAGFYRCWTRKEAYIKALGDGITYGLGRFDVSLDTAETRVLADRNTDRLVPWKYSELSLVDGYAAVVVADAPDYQLHTEELKMHSVFRLANSTIV